ncbi:uncharacterized protein LOC135844442 [Planococcus citri]|uniref:uncharacterized protein LOC135844442 n=1 Tax=Planococcus citri TaxID=170843 RepID=UPI0031F88050
MEASVSAEAFQPLDEILEDEGKSKTLPKESLAFRNQYRLEESSVAENSTSAVSGKIIKPDPLKKRIPLLNSCTTAVSQVPDEELPFALQMELYFKRVEAHSKKKKENRKLTQATIREQRTKYEDNLRVLKTKGYFPPDCELVKALESTVKDMAEIEKELEISINRLE